MSNQFNIDDTWAIEDENVFKPIAAKPKFGGGVRS